VFVLQLLTQQQTCTNLLKTVLVRNFV